MERADSAAEQRLLVGAIAASPDETQAELLLRWTENTHAQVRRLAVGTLVRLRGDARRAGRERVIAALRDNDPDVRVAAAYALKSLTTEAEAARLLAHALADETVPKVAHNLAHAIVRLNRTDRWEQIRAAIRDSAPDVRKAVERLLPDSKQAR